MYTYSFEKLEVWKEARKMVVWIYKLTECYPPEEKFGLTYQLRKGAVSVVSNIAEGSARNTPKDKANFYQNAYSCVTEILNQLIVSCDLGYLLINVLTEKRAFIENLTQKIAALRNSELKKHS